MASGEILGEGGNDGADGVVATLLQRAKDRHQERKGDITDIDAGELEMVACRDAANRPRRGSRDRLPGRKRDATNTVRHDSCIELVLVIVFLLNTTPMG